MKRFILVGAALALLVGGIAPAAVRAGTITYDIVNYPAEQNGHTLSGLIITDGKIGALAASDILSWTFTVDSSITLSGGASSVTIDGDVEASPFLITLAQPPVPTVLFNANGFSFQPVGGGSPVFILWSRLTPALGLGPQDNEYKFTNGQPSNPVWDTFPGDTLGGTNPWVIAENPEPASLTLMSVGGVALLGYGWRRRRRAAE